MARFEVKMTGATFQSCTEQYILFRRAREVAGTGFKIVVLIEAVAAVSAVLLAVSQQEAPLTRILFFLAAVFLAWRAVSKVQGRDTRSYIQRARAQKISPEDGAKELVVSFDEEGCTLGTAGGTLPGQDVEERKLFSYDQVSGLFRSESYFLAACDKASSICFPLAGLTGGTPEELTAFLEERCQRKAVFYPLETEKFQTFLR